jgi:hypothetical protein
MASILLWLSAASGSFFLLGIMTQAINLQQILAPHVNNQAREALTEAPGGLFVLLFLVQDLDYTLLAGITIRLIIQQPAERVFFPICWLFSAVLSLLLYQPIWSHYSPLIAIPITWLAAHALPIGLEFFQMDRWTTRVRTNLFKSSSIRGWAAGFILFACVAVPIKSALISEKMSNFLEESHRGFLLVQQVQSYKPVTQWILTDLPILAFYSHIKVPPDTVVFSSKRIKSGDLNQKELFNILEIYRPEQVVLGLYPQVQQSLEQYLQRDYTKVYQRKQVIQYVLNTLVKYP